MKFTSLLIAITVFDVGFSYITARHKSPDTKALQIASVIWRRVDNIKSSTLSREQRLFIKTIAILGGKASKDELQLPSLWPHPHRRDINVCSQHIKQSVGQGLSLAYLNFANDLAELTFLKEQVYQVNQMWDDITAILNNVMKISTTRRHRELTWLIKNFLVFYKYRAEEVNIELATGGNFTSLVSDLVDIQTEVHNLISQYYRMLQQRKHFVKQLTGWTSFSQSDPAIPKIQVKKITEDIPLEKDNVLALILKFKVLSAYQIFPTVPFCAIANIIFFADNLCANLFAGITNRQAEILKELSKRL
ncbi:HFL003Cp [Eremothecium sinecaudum]|uniref:HFL003Cp n=1 Tax=Eremothecium sinecaudum TaxID=45286 RepID=A0A109UZT4_9SACH|nr:HFL003Cp [Eremothecium sinecaudum]AMD21853.1 HFL003Cp [Eremothecium sinecaudum]